MKVLKLSPYYEPEQVSSSHLTKDIEETLIKEGFEIENYTPTPTRGVSKDTRSKYKKIKYEEKYDGKIKLYRFSMFSEFENPILRAIRYILCNVIQYFKGINAKNINIIMAASTPPTQGILVSMVKKRLKVPVIYNLQDIFPDSLLHTGLAKENSVLMKIGRRIENYTYRNMDKIIVISNDFKENIVNKGVDPKKIEVVYNWIDTKKVKPISRDKNVLFNKFNLDLNLFYVVYAGNLGYAQNIEVIIKAAKELHKYNEIKFIIFGKGSQELYYKEMAEKLKLENIVFLPLQPYNLVSEVYSLGDVSIVSCQKGIGKNAMPSKTWSILSAGTPVLASYDEDTDLHKIITRNKIGLFAKSDDTEEFKDAILKLYYDKKLCGKLGRNGRKYVIEHMSKEVAMSKYIDIINETLEEYNV